MRLIDDRPAEAFPTLPQPGDWIHAYVGNGLGLPARVVVAELRGETVHLEAEIPHAMLAGQAEPMPQELRRRAPRVDGATTVRVVSRPAA